MKLLIGLLLSAGCFAQTFTTDSPTASQAITGYSGFQFTGHAASAASAYLACWNVDAHPISYNNCGTSSDGIHFSLPWNTFKTANGTHSVIATLYDALGTLLATSPAVSFTNPNTWPIASAPIMTITTGTPLGSNWSTSVNVTATFTGGGTTDNKQVNFLIDGLLQGTVTTTATTAVFPIITTQFLNAVHKLAVVALDLTTGATYTCGGVNNSFTSMGDFSADVTFLNSVVPMEVRTGSREVFVAPAATASLSPTVVNTDGSLVSSPTFDYYSQNTPFATVNSSGVITGVATGNAIIRVMNPTKTAADLTTTSPRSDGVMFSTSAPFTASDVGQAIRIDCVNSWLCGDYEIASVDTSHSPALASFNLCTNSICVAATGSLAPGISNTGVGTFHTGESATAWAFVNPTNHTCYFGIDNSIQCSYNSALARFVQSSFFSYNFSVQTDQPYSPGFLTDYKALHFTHLENSLGGPPQYSGGGFPTTQLAWEAAYVANINALNAVVSPYGFQWVLTGDGGWNGNGALLYTATRSPAVVGGATWSPAPLTDALNMWGTSATIADMSDEVPWGNNPQGGPFTFGSIGGPTQIVATGDACVVTWPVPNVNFASQFIISGSSTTNMNSVAGTVYTATSIIPTGFNFTCTGVANGTYNSGNDAALQINPYVASGGWFNPTTGSSSVGATDHVLYTAFQNFRTWVNAASTGRMGMSWPIKANLGAYSLHNWESPPQGDYATIYTTSGNHPYLRGQQNETSTIIDHGNYARALYGNGFSPDRPFLFKTGAVANNYGLQGTPCTVASFTGNTITCSAPHGVTNVLSGASRLTLYGMSTSADNGQYYIISAPTPTTLTVSRAVPSFSSLTAAAAAGGTITFSPSGYTEVLDHICTNGLCNGAANSVSCVGTGGTGCEIGASFVPTTLDTNLPRHRGETFTFTMPNSNTNFNTRTFIYPVDNTNVAISRSLFFYREIPVGTSTSGNASIISDDFFVCGRNGSNGCDNDPRGAFQSAVYESYAIRSAGQRLYGSGFNPDPYVDAAGWTNSAYVTAFADSTVTAGPATGCNQTIQLYAHPHWPNGTSQPISHAVGQSNAIGTYLKQYLLQPSLPSPDYGPTIESFARAGTPGDILIVQNMSDTTQTRTFDLTSYLQSGQQIIRYFAADSGITINTLTAGTTSDTESLPPATTMIWVFPAVFAGTLQQPIISVRLADIATATKVVVRYNYDPFWLDIANLTVDCSTGTACLLPVDRNIGPVSYRLLYLDTNGKVLATGEVQTL